MNHDEIQQSLEAYALGTLDPAERAEVAAHIATCEECRSLVDDFEHVAAALPAALALAAPVPPSDIAGQRIKRAIRRRARRSRLASGIAAAAVVLLGVAVAWVWRSERTLADEREHSERLIEQQEILFEVVDSPDRHRVVLRPDSDESDSYGKAFTRPDMPFVVIMAGRLPPADPGLEYHVWLTSANGTTVLAGRLVPNQEGFASLVYTAESAGPMFSGIQVTTQPSGATEPADDVVLSDEPA